MKLCLAMPSLGHEEFVEDAVRSVLSAWPGEGALEFRILDAGSSEQVRERIRTLIRDVDGAQLHCRPDRGQADALRRCFSETDADILGWLNTDDLVLPGALDIVLRRFAADDTVDALYGDGLFIDSKGSIRGAYPVSRFDANLLKSFCFISQPSTFFRRSAYQRAGGIDAELQFAMDYDLWLKMLKTGARFERIRGFLSATRLHDETKTAMKHEEFTDEVLSCQHRAFPAAASVERAAWRSYRYRMANGVPRSFAFLQASLFGGQLRGLPRRLVWSARLAWLLGIAAIRARCTPWPSRTMRDLRRRSVSPGGKGPARRPNDSPEQAGWSG